MRRLSLIVGFLLATLSPVSADEITYKNARFGTILTLPADFIEAVGPAPTNGDGRIFSADGIDTTIAVYGSFNLESDSAQTLLEVAAVRARSRGDHVTYSASGDGWYVMSGFRSDDIFYERHELSGDVIHSVALLFPADKQKKYDAFIGQLAQRLQTP
ncbi:MAG: hypothetical protein AAGG69_05325 [Pseudomonadota bacterium]